jgi:hypothetical protein
MTGRCPLRNLTQPDRQADPCNKVPALAKLLPIYWSSLVVGTEGSHILLLSNGM